MDTLQQLIEQADEALLERAIRQAVNRLADLDNIGGAQDFLSDQIARLESEVEPCGQGSRGRDEWVVRAQEGHADV